jgi:hypothetical protein
MVHRYYLGNNHIGCIVSILRLDVCIRNFNYFLLSFQAKFIAVLILVPWLADFVVHDYVLMPFLDR